MRLAGLLHCAGLHREKFNTLRRRDQLPFYARAGAGDGWQTFTLGDAFRLRLSALLTEPAAGDAFGGIGPSDAAKLIGNALCRAPADRVADLAAHLPAVWLAGAEFAGSTASGEAESWLGWFAGPLAGFPDWIAAQLADPTAEALRGARAVRVLGMVNATAAALDVLAAAKALGLPIIEAEENPQ